MKLLKASALMAVLLVCAVLLLGVLSLRAHPVRGAGGGATGSNGDVNCDGKVNIADAIAIIQWQFAGGTEPCALAQDAGILEKLTSLQNSVDSLFKRLPAPEDIVTIRGEAHFPSPGGTQIIYQVPADKWLVLTAIMESSSVPPTLFSVSGGQSKKVTPGIQVPHSNGYTWTSGVVFPPGAKVALQNSETSRASDASFYLNGYLVGGE